MHFDIKSLRDARVLFRDFMDMTMSYFIYKIVLTYSMNNPSSEMCRLPFVLQSS